jgi:hypothetical protein
MNEFGAQGPDDASLTLQQARLSIDLGTDDEVSFQTTAKPSSEHTTRGDIPITVSILNYRRWHEFMGVLQSVYEQTACHPQIIVVDNNSGPDVLSLIRRQALDFTLIERTNNIGTSARNLGIRSAAGEVIVTLDNDVSFAIQTALQEIMSAFERHPKAGCVTFEIKDPLTNNWSARDWMHPWVYDASNSEDRQTTFISEGACAFRRSVFDKVAPYWEALFINMEGADLALRILNAGYEIWHAPRVQVYHCHSKETRDAGRDFYHNPRNLLLLAYRNIPTSNLFGFLVPRLMALACCSCIRGCFLVFLAGLWSGLTFIKSSRGLRQPIDQQTMEQFDELRGHAPSLLSRLCRYWRFVG